MRDAEALLDDEVEKRTEFIRSVFWPASKISKDTSRRGPAFVCSAKIGAMMREMRSFLDSATELPSWDSFWTPERKEVCLCVFVVLFILTQRVGIGMAIPGKNAPRLRGGNA